MVTTKRMRCYACAKTSKPADRWIRRIIRLQAQNFCSQQCADRMKNYAETRKGGVCRDCNDITENLNADYCPGCTQEREGMQGYEEAR